MGPLYIASYTLDSTQDTSNISFTSNTVSSMPEEYELPAYDDHGQEYVYFVREALSGDEADNYAVQYSAEDGTVYKYGAPAGGTITNTRRKKEAVSISKVWKNPSGLDGIEGVSVQVSIYASSDQGKTYDELTVYSDTDTSYDVLTGDDKAKAETINGFSAAQTQGEVIYYVNSYDSEGNPYDMTSAKIVETVTSADGKVWTSKTNTADVATTSVKDADGNQYTVKSTYNETVAQGDGTNQYLYTQTNTISAERDYKLIKEWSNSITDEAMSDIQAVKFKLERRSTKNNADGSQAAYETVDSTEADGFFTVEGDGRNWTLDITKLPKYDNDGYEYYYRATEVSLVTTDGKTIPISSVNSSRKWSSIHYRTPDQTKVVNTVSGSGRGFVTISKIWQDNGDSSNREDILVHIYDRTSLKKALEGLSAADTDIIDLDSLGLKSYSCNLTSANEYTQYANYAEIDKAIAAEGTDTSNYTSKNYVVLEYQIGKNDGNKVSYSYGQLKNAISGDEDTAYSVSGSIETKNHSYIAGTYTNPAEQLVMFTNTRTGKTSLTVNKTWKDDENAEGLRPSVMYFQLYLDGYKYTNIPESVSVSALDANGIENGTDSCTVSLDHKTGLVKVTSLDANDNTAEKWIFKVTGLNTYSATAEPYNYNVTEVTANTSSDDTHANDDSNIEEDSLSGKVNIYSYSSKKLQTEVTDDGKNQSYTFNFENTLTGKTSHVAYKYWKDSSVGSDNRPDLYINVYRYLKSEAEENSNKDITELEPYQPYKDYKTQLWTQATDFEEESSEYESGYNWKISVEDLPLYNENGEEYVYVFTESMNNDGKTVLGNYLSKTETKTVAAKDSETGIADSYEVFTNTISGYMTLTGNKTWSGLKGYKTDELPEPTITLYRTIDNSITNLQTMTNAEVQQLISEGKITKVDTTKLIGDGKSKYSFPDEDISDEELDQGLICKQADGSYMLPKFDADGNRYNYLVRENIPDQIASQLYNEVNSNGTLSNRFRDDINRRQITVTKTWDRSAVSGLDTKENQYPSVTYTLYRYEAGKEDSTTEEIESYTISASEFAASEDGSASHTFGDLLVYSPTGVQYFYYIKEKAIDGYSINYTDETGITDGSLADSKVITGTNAGGSEGTLTIDQSMLNELKSNDRIDVISLPENWNTENAVNDTAVSTCNVYDKQGTVTLSGSKKWNDYLDFEGLRPNKITVNLTRRTNNEKNQNNKVESIKINLDVLEKEDSSETAPYIVWNYNTADTADSNSSNEWTYTIYNLARYAANGMPYIYTLSEEQVTGYQKANSVSSKGSGESEKLAALENNLGGTYTVRKNWSDGYNKYNMRPANVTIKLQRSIDETNFEDIVVSNEQIGTYDEKTGSWSNGFPSVSQNDEGKNIVSIQLTKANVVKNTKDSAWEYTFTNLPTQDKDGNPYTYRCVETEVGGIAVTGTTEKSAGSYKCEESYLSGKTTITNTLTSTSLQVTKKWEGDQDDYYQTRPNQLTFTLQKKKLTDDQELSDGTWEDVLDENGEAYTFTISKSDNWTKTLTDLPKTEVEKDADGTTNSYTLYYRAVEVHAKDSAISDLLQDILQTKVNKASGAENYEDTTDYDENSDNSYSFDTAKNLNQITITNKLRLDDTPKSITVTKTWYMTNENNAKTATFELVYKKKDDSTDSWHCYGEQTIPTNGDWSKHTGKANNSGKSCLLRSIQSTDETQSVTWKDLPKYDAEGNELEYKVIEHSINDYSTICSESKSTDSTSTTYAFSNIESRGVVNFTKTGSDNANLDTHNNHTNRSGESTAYFAVYTDKNCTNQVAGMVPLTDEKGNLTDTMVLTNKTEDGKTTLNKTDKNGVAYLYALDTSDNENGKYPFTLLSGTYYVKELNAPASYVTDSTVRKIVVGNLTVDSTFGQSEENDAKTELLTAYKNNKAQIMLTSDKLGSTDYKWANTENKVSIYKLDQFGQQVSLESDKYLELTVEGDGNSFPCGTSTIYLYQDADNAATDTKGNTISYISYTAATDTERGYWTCTGLFEPGMTYTLSEPKENVPTAYKQASSISFTMGSNGKITVTSSNETAEASNTPLSANGDNSKNTYKVSADNNQIVLRDTTRKLKDLTLLKKDSSKTDTNENAGISKISFKLYKYSSKDDQGNITDAQSVLAEDVTLTTDENGQITLSQLDDKIMNQLTGDKLNYGLEIGNYYFEEVEAGNSNTYRLLGKIFFSIERTNSGSDQNYNAYAELKDQTNDTKHVIVSGDTITLMNDPVTDQAKTLDLTKTDSTGEKKLAGSRFTLSYGSINGASSTSAQWTKNCITGEDGKLYLADNNWNTTSFQPDISAKGTYTLTEVQAPDGYTIGVNGDEILNVELLSFNVNSENKIVDITKKDSARVTNTAVESTDGEDTGLAVTVANQQTEIKLAKKSDINTKTSTKSCNQADLNGEALAGASLEIYKGTEIVSANKVTSLDTKSSTWTYQGLKEDTIYTLHEAKAPVGYMEAEDIYFLLHGTAQDGTDKLSQLYVWTGKGKPSTTDLMTGSWEKTSNIENNTLTMVDEAIIAPVDLQKVLASYDEDSYSSLENVSFTVKAGETELGTAITNEYGYLVWQSITKDGYASKLIYNADGKQVSTNEADSVIGNSIILQQNAEGYDFTEAEAPDSAYNDQQTYHITITAENYKSYKATVSDSTDGSSAYDTNSFVNIVDANANSADGYTVKTLSSRTENTGFTTAEGLAINKTYQSRVSLHKYDANEEGEFAAVPGTEFTLYRINDGKEEIYQKAYTVTNAEAENETEDTNAQKEILTLNEDGVFTTDANENLTIEIREKGSYVLKETKAAAGYLLNEENSYSFTLKDLKETQTAEDESELITVFAYGETNLLADDENGVANERQMGSVTLRKTDADTGETLNDVVYTLERTDVPLDAEGNELESYLLDHPVELVTGKSYQAEKDEDGQWIISEVSDDSLNLDGQIYISGLNWGSYTLTEKTENSGYKLEENTHSFVIDGRSTGEDGSCDALNLSFEDVNSKNSVTFYKTNMIDEEAGVSSADQIKGLEGAEFAIYEDDGKDSYDTDAKVSFYLTADSTEKVTTFTSGADGKVTIYGLATDIDSDNPKLYHLVETKAPKGYKLQTEDILFSIDRKGNVQILDSDGETYIDTDLVTMEDEAIKISIRKVNADGSKVLKGAEFELTDNCSITSGQSSCDHLFADGKNTKLTVTTAADGTVMIPVESLIAGHSYTLKETKAPNGYKGGAEVSFTVAEDGTIDQINSKDQKTSLDEAKTTLIIKNDLEDASAAKNVKTGDFHHPAFWLGCMITAIALAFAILRRRKKIA
jgi:hypothetical protein